MNSNQMMAQFLGTLGVPFLGAPQPQSTAATPPPPPPAPTTPTDFDSIPQMQLIQDYRGQPFVDAIMDISAGGAMAANARLAEATQGLQAQAAASGKTLDQVMAELGIPLQALEGINTNLGGAFDTQPMRDTLTGMDFQGLQDRYESQYVDQMVDPALARMREDEARRMAQLEASGAAVGGGSNTRMAVEMARTTDEGMRSRAEMEANLRNTALRQAQELGLQEAGLRGQFADTAGRLGLSQSDMEASIRERSSQLGISREQAIQGILNDIASTSAMQFGMQRDVSAAQQTEAQGNLDAARLGMAGAGVGLEQSELERQILTEQGQAPLTMEAWYRNLIGTQPAQPLPSGGTTTQTQSGGGPSAGSQILGAGVSLLGAFLSSDERVKEDVEPITGALDIIRQQRPSVYRYTDPAYDRLPIEGRRSAGLMAQDLESIPGAVVENDHGVKMVDPYPVLSTIAAAVQELDAKVEAMRYG